MGELEVQFNLKVKVNFTLRSPQFQERRVPQPVFKMCRKKKNPGPAVNQTAVVLPVDRYFLTELTL